VDDAGNHHSDELKVPDNIMLHLLPPHAPELTSQGYPWDENCREDLQERRPQILSGSLRQGERAALYIERNPVIMKSITSFPHIVKSI
jgi:hypothetical protein